MKNSGIKILAVDDNPDNLITIKALLGDAFPDAFIFSAAEGYACLEIAEKEFPDVILLDILMPGMDGFQVCEKLKADKKLKEIPVVFVTAMKADKVSRIRALECGAEAFLSKPIDETELTAQVRAMIKIKAANDEKHNEKERLEALVTERTEQLKESHNTTLKLLDDLKKENESRKKSEATLHQSKMQYDNLVSRLPIGIFIMRSTPKGLISYDYVNPMIAEVLNVKPGRTIKDSRDLFHMLHPEDIEGFVQMNQDCIQRKLPFSWLGRTYIKGDLRWIHIESSPEFLEGGDTLWHGMVMDVTERKEAEDKLKESEDRYSTAFLTSPYAILITKLSDGMIIDVNEAFVQMTGYTAAEACNRTTVELDLWANINDRKQIISSLNEGTNVSAKEILVRIKSGSVITCLFSARIIKLNNESFLLSSVSDISDRKRMENALRTNEEKFKAIANYSASWEAWFNPQGQLIWMNSYAYELTGYTAEEYLAATDVLAMIFVPEDLALAQENFERAMQGISGNDFELRALHRSGSSIWLSISWRPIYDTKGSSIGFRTSSRDISKRKLVEQEVKNADENFREMTNMLPQVVFETDILGKFTYVNHKAYEIFGYPLSESVIGRDSLKFHAPHEHKRVVENIQRRLSGQMLDSQEYSMLRKDGSTFQALVFSNQIVKNEKVIGLRGIIVDISDRQRVEARLRVSEQRYRLLIETAHEGILVAQAGRLVFFNKMLLSLTGYTEEELKAIPFLDLIHPDDRAMVKSNYLARINGAEVSPKYQFRGILKNNVIRWFELGGVKIEWEGHPAVMDFVTDITERKLTENRMLLSSKILNLLNSTTPLAETIQLAFKLIQEETACDAVGIRLSSDNDFPYFIQNGFDASFLQAENSIVCSSLEGWNLKDANGQLKLECTCGLVIAGKTDPGSSMFTVGGSFWTNNSEVLLELAAGDDPRIRPRNRCIHAGYQSMALIPIRAKGEIVGLLQLNDHKKGYFTLELVQFYEGICEIIGVALMRKQAEEALEKSHDLLYRLSEQVPGVIYQYRLYPDGRSCFPYASSGMNEIYEVSPEDVREDATPVFGRLHPDDYQRVSDLILQSSRTLDYFFCEFRVLLPRQGLRWRYSAARPERMDDGGTMWHGIIYDVSDRKYANEALVVSEEKYRTMLNVSPDGIIVINMKGIITEISELALTLFNAGANEDLIGKHFFRFIPTEWKNVSREIIRKTMRDGLSQNTELKIRKKNQSLFTAEANATLISGQDHEPVSFMIIIRDITKRKNTETKQIHADRMANLGEMASGIAHEINQPLNNISMALDNLLFESEKTQSIDLEAFKTKTNKIFENINRMKHITDHIRAFSRSHDDNIVALFNVNLSVENAAFMMDVQLKQHGISLSLLLNQKLPMINGNNYKFEQVLINLLANARDAVLEKQLKLEYFFDMDIKIQSYQKDQYVYVAVSDNGLGITTEHIQNVFLPFYTTKVEGKGTGLGLSICYQIIKEMDGAIEIFSEPMEGTQVVISFSAVQSGVKSPTFI